MAQNKGFTESIVNQSDPEKTLAIVGVNIQKETLEYYESNAVPFYYATVNVDFSQAQQRFLDKLKDKPFILDFGCGSGRDTLAFLKAGAMVEAWDGSQTMCSLASKLTGIPVRNALFSELDAAEKYDGIWACASILHLPASELKTVLSRIEDALRSDGVLYTSFKYGTKSGYRNGRYFTNFTENQFRTFLKTACGLKIEEVWISGDVRPGREEEKWLNLLMRKKEPQGF